MIKLYKDSIVAGAVVYGNIAYYIWVDFDDTKLNYLRLCYSNNLSINTFIQRVGGQNQDFSRFEVYKWIVN